ncbi:MAG: aminomethyl-transferring glycine dehydrogenase [Verrucomicrobiota bacterium]
MTNPHAFAPRHLGADDHAIAEMLAVTKHSTLDAHADDAVPEAIRERAPLDLPDAATEAEALDELRQKMNHNVVARSFIGLGYYESITPPVIQRCIFENPGWYTAYTPYQAEIAQGRLEALLNFQTMVADLCGLDVANASLLDEGTAVAEAVTMCSGMKPKADKVFISDRCHPQTIDVVKTRAEPVGLEIVVGDENSFNPNECDNLLAIVVQYPDKTGDIVDHRDLIEKTHEAGGLVIMATDLLALTLLEPPGALGADIAVGSSQRFGIPLGNGGPHAAFLACRDSLKRKLPGRLVGVSQDRHGNPAFRLSLQTREQHIRRDKATSNICTAQVLLAVMASMYAVYHGPDRLRRIAEEVNRKTARLFVRFCEAGATVKNPNFFDTLTVEGLEGAVGRALDAGFNVRDNGDGCFSVSLDEATTDLEVKLLGDALIGGETTEPPGDIIVPDGLRRTSKFLQHEIFNQFHTETEMLRYLRRLEGKDLALNHSMIPLGSCTMKLNSAAEMIPLSWPTVGRIHPFAPPEQREGYTSLAKDLEVWLAEICGMDATSLQPNAGSQGEYAGLLAIRQFHLSNDDTNRDICLIPSSAHGTNPASAVMVGMKVVVVKCDDEGNIDLEDLRAKTEKHSANLAALMITYPSTHGVFESSVKDICSLIHDHGGQVYMDGANLNAQVGLCSPGAIGADVCHLNLHKTFCIPHGGGGPGVGPICVKAHLDPFLPGHRFSVSRQTPPVCAAPLGSASILVISWMYIRMMGGLELTKATKLAILNANYVAKRLEHFFPVLYRGESGCVAHECIIDLRPFKNDAGIEVEDVAKRLMDYGFHAPTMSWPVPGTLMIEPTESESKAELDRFCDAMISIHGEIRAIANGESDTKDNALKNAPHTAEEVVDDEWNHAYSRESAAFPIDWVRAGKFWPTVARIDNVYGDRNLVCSCPAVDEFSEEKVEEAVAS